MADLKKVLKEVQRGRDDERRPVTPAESVIPSSAPAIRKGEDSMTSRPFRFVKALGLIGGVVQRDEAKVEYDLVTRFKKALGDTQNLVQGATANGIFLPGDRSFLPDDARGHDATREIIAASAAGVAGFDPEEMVWFAKNYAPQYQKTAMSYLTDSTGGALVAPPEMGELIPLMRNKSALDRAGAKQVPLPAQGKWVAPRVTSASTAYAVTENTAITESNPTVGEVSMMAKKIAVIVRMPNELFKYASGAVDALLRDDIAKTLALAFDYECLYGAGSGGQTKGLVYYTGSNEVYDYAASTPAPKGIGANGNTLRPEDGYNMAAIVEDRNFDANGFKWVLRPTLKGSINGYRADAVTAGDAAGPFAQAITRLVGTQQSKDWCGYDMVASAQVRNTVTKGSASNLTELFGGVWSEFLMGMYGAVEFATNVFGEATFIADQTLIRGILHCDAVPKYPGAFVWYKALLQR